MRADGEGDIDKKPELVREDWMGNVDECGPSLPRHNVICTRLERFKNKKK